MKFSSSEISRLWPIAKRRISKWMVDFVQRIFSNEKVVKDVFGSHSSKRVLLCHLPEAFTSKKLPKYHSNFTECYTIAKCFDRLGYSVDCTSRANTGLDYSPYDIVCGINGNAYMGSFAPDKNIKPLRIFYSVGAHMCYNYRVTTGRNLDFCKRHGLWLLSSNRYIPGDARVYYEEHFSDAVICLGNEYVMKQFLKEEDDIGKYRFQHAFFFPVTEPSKDKEFGKCRRNILWFGSSGMLHKGLDIAIDFAVEHPEFTLHICGGNRQESAFWKYYKPIIEAHENIVMHGFVDIESDAFAKVLEQCGILLNPSVSEGGAVSVLNVLGNGALLPVYSKGTGLDLSAVGIETDAVSYDNFKEALLEADRMTDDEFRKKAWAAHNLVKEHYTLKNYEDGIYMHLKEIIEKNR